MHFDYPEDYFYYYLMTDGRTILDAGSGLGSNTLFLAQRIEAEGGKGRIIAVDSDESDLEYTKKRLGNLLPYVQLLNERLDDMASIPNYSIDLIFLSNTLIWLESKSLYSLKVLSEFNRVLKPGGIISIIDQMPIEPFVNSVSLWSRIWEIQKSIHHLTGEPHLTEIEPQNIAYALQLTGFAEIEYRTFNPEPIQMEHTRGFIDRLLQKLRGMEDHRLAAAAEQSLLDLREKASAATDYLPPVYVLHAKKPSCS